jgi:hypothetical protein
MAVRTALTPQSLVRPMRAVLYWGLLAGALALVLGSAIGYLADGIPGVWGALLGGGLAVLFFTATVALSLATARLQPNWLGLAVIISWLLKTAALIIVLALLRAADFYSRPVFFGCLLIGTFGYLGMEVWIVSRTKVLYLETEFAPEHPVRR